MLAIADEVYDRMVYDQAAHISLATLPGMWDRTLTLNSVGKTFSVTGWKIGYAVGPAALNEALRAAHQWVTFATSTPFQEATAVALEQAATNGYYQQLRAEYDARRVSAAPDSGARWHCPRCRSRDRTSSAPISARWAFADDRAFCRFLTTELGVAAIPTSAFYADPASAPAFARFCFAKKHETLEAAGERLQRLKAKV